MENAFFQPELSSIFVPPPILAADGKPLLVGSIVGMAPDEEGTLGNFGEYRGVVVRPYTRYWYPDHTVGIFFNIEMDKYHLWPLTAGHMEIDEWDKRYKAEMKAGGIDFLLENDLWVTCPRIHCFKPEELLVQEGFEFEHLAKRLFPGYYHSVYTLSKEWPQDPKAYLCVIKDCPNPATEISLCNVWGSVYALFTCKSCHGMYNGRCGDDLPAQRKQFLTHDRLIMQPLVPAVA